MIVLLLIGCQNPPEPILLRSGAVVPTREAAGERWLLGFEEAPGVAQRLAVAEAATVHAPVPGGWLVSAEDPGALDAIPGLAWRTPFRGAHKLAPEIAAVAPGDGPVIVVLQLFTDADPQAFADELSARGLDVAGAGSTPRAGRVMLLLDAAQVVAEREALAADERVAWVGRRLRRELLNDTAVWVGQSADGRQRVVDRSLGAVALGQHHEARGRGVAGMRAPSGKVGVRVASAHHDTGRHARLGGHLQHAAHDLPVERARIEPSLAGDDQIGAVDRLRAGRSRSRRRRTPVPTRLGDRLRDRQPSRPRHLRFGISLMSTP